ncbi:vWA domain-containing protein [Flammeovirga aprica]|uniref:VWA domain-containing protein n=1 Tax=Flammeovirga aprica JL-4 TaxID=694437 RepID=A0A7X9XAX0_9BACT|nr:VWA domain-containing protein [Flammeovirga aprica]NME70120.1 VWA domain-containing protein [Flammeovirga aprica JL-4]
MRRLPVYILVDVSYSMQGGPIQGVQSGVEFLVSELRKNPHALETVYLSLVTFSTNAETLVPLTELMDFQTPQLAVSGMTSLGEGLELVAVKSELEVTKSSPTQKGDWKPLVFIMTDGEPTDNWRNGLSIFESKKWGVVVACAAGDGANTSVLQEITPNVVKLNTADEASIVEFFKWVSSSIGVSSTKVETSGVEASGIDDLPKPPSCINLVK